MKISLNTGVKFKPAVFGFPELLDHISGDMIKTVDWEIDGQNIVTERLEADKRDLSKR